VKQRHVRLSELKVKLVQRVCLVKSSMSIAPASFVASLTRAG